MLPVLILKRTPEQTRQYPDRSKSVGWFVTAWLEGHSTSISDMQGTWNFLNTSNSIELIRKHFQVPVGNMVLFIEEFLKEDSSLRTTTAMEVLDNELDQYARAIEIQRDSLKFTPIIIAVLRAEHGQLTDRRDLTKALHAGDEQILLRAIGAVARIGDWEYAREVLTEFLLDERTHVSEAAKKVLRSE